MAHSIVSKPLGLVLIAAAHMVLNVSNQVKVTGVFGSNITLQFTFTPNISLTESSHFIIHHYTTGQNKVAEYKQGSEENVFNVQPQISSVIWHITNLKLNSSGKYYANLITETGPAKKSYEVELVVLEENRSNTAPPLQSETPTTVDGVTSFHTVTVAVVSPVMLLVAVFLRLTWFLRNKDKRRQPQQQSSNASVQSTEDVSAPTLVYSILDFPRRTQLVLDTNPRDSDYAAISYVK